MRPRQSGRVKRKAIACFETIKNDKYNSRPVVCLWSPGESGGWLSGLKARLVDWAA